VFTVIRSTKEEPDCAPAASLRVRRSLSSQPPWQHVPTASGVSRPVMKGQVRAAPGPDPPGSSRCRIKGPSHIGSSRTPLHPARRTQAIWQYQPVPALSGLLPPSPAPPGSGCPQLHRPAATGSAAKVSHLHSKHCASRRTHTLRHAFITAALDAGVPLRCQRPLGSPVGRPGDVQAGGHQFSRLVAASSLPAGRG
jgi:hypothetical protein